MLNNSFLLLKNLNYLMFAVTMISSFKRVFPRNTHVLEQNG